MITGGYDESKAENSDGHAIIDFAKHLSAQAIIQNHELRCGNMSSLDELVITSACEQAQMCGRDADKVVISYHPKGESPSTIQGGVNESSIEHWNSMDGRKLAIPEPVDQADVLILLGGYGDASGTFTAANWARQIGTPILPIATFNMAAGEIYDDLPSTPEMTKITGLTQESLQVLKKSKAVLTTEAAMQQYAEKIIALAEQAALSRDVFLIMSFDKTDDLLDYKAAVESVCKEAGFEAIRTDTRPMENTHQIVDVIHEHIQSCGFVIADLTNQRPNVYYEIGYAMGLNKKLILTSKKDEAVHFDLNGYNRIEWSGSENLKQQLRPIIEEYARSFGLAAG